MSSNPSPRMPWVDHLRTLVILLVVNMHACVTYSHVGDWYILSEHEPTFMQKVPFILWQVHLQSFFMGVLFFISGYFAHGSIKRRAPGLFLRERLFRLGLPALFYMLVIHPFILLGLNPWRAKFPPVLTYYANVIRTGRFLRDSGPLWFAVALLIFCFALAAWRALKPGAHTDAPALSQPLLPSTPGSGKILLFALAIGVSSFAIRMIYPIGTNILNLQLCFFPQYIAGFAVGFMAARGNWLVPLASSSVARRAGWIAVISGPVLLLIVLKFGSRDGLAAFVGGLHWQAFVLALWEQCIGVGLALGLMSLLSRKLNRDGPVLRWMSDRGFAVYVLHAPVLIALMMLFRSLPQNPYALAALLTIAGLIVTFAVADIARRIPGLRAIL